jgi:hypothetical protein
MDARHTGGHREGLLAAGVVEGLFDDRSTRA